LVRDLGGQQVSVGWRIYMLGYTYWYGDLLAVSREIGQFGQ